MLRSVAWIPRISTTSVTWEAGRGMPDCKCRKAVERDGVLAVAMERWKCEGLESYGVDESSGRSGQGALN